MNKIILVALLSLGTALLAGCKEGAIIYEGQQMPVSKAEERIEDHLEVENSNLDLEISIYQESDD